MKFSEIIIRLGEAATDNSLSTSQDQDPEITGLAALDEATLTHLSYVEGAKFASLVSQTNASALILPQDKTLQSQAQERGIAWIATPDPRLLFAQAIALFYKPYHPAPEIHATAVIHPTAKIGNDVYIGPHAVIQQDVEIGNRAVIHPNVVIYPDAKIGDRTTLHANCTIHERTRIGSDCVIHSGTVIGAEGFGFVPTRTGWLKMEQSGYTVLEDHVEVGCNSAIDRPAVGETRIGSHTIIDNMVQIGHGCQIGTSCAIAGQAGLAGGVKVGNRVILAGQSGVSNQVKIGDGAIASAQAGIHNDVAPGEIVSGMPAVPHKLYLKASAIYHRLPEMYQTFRQLQRQLGKK
ncbi:UDP-3-O-(3-hydroxymyristoyl)glucosamine N-acyltransferase [Nodularia spumigena CS-584]|jgi:UDP-3-O-[3-hydroxymyristoyl] glucosamine N-acyltransferase|uniref:UDP-3-O-acylglucosamine N-acyltransferase n=2 Tax=Nodularia spumigena TaxID=70799 RepID=A0A2S0QAN0_NODSP|nr:UDP-3-O-(3-hydroxymyristoyl)glucosamine N-acyltransferase [Nodularia spumigena]AHJ28455.1 UDP-3-O-[3-hydroxymyristoyl] glucosamine N-acyltransferase [Nodularia spumigena CCY9414]AVZ31428.1 UDP-3-O-(3-hydroxymyristoyl)glucosamine N-acyltransferase [Nodularia spumigena UHCC 0039]EAW43665.1 UDP-3-O-[3-hydroxymyristoyl] glucosamine N-acyltransferase [Nodularia spumigena CCY9414]MDB9382586.1 UDP-3-O-(3-hydroxymyristoyl)glucosamine N-acyltransferase [Nodularia spumigena CS-584]MEA5526632.1 UDP-3-